MHNREAFLLWCDISKLVDAALGVSMLADYDCAGTITDSDERQLASGATSTAAVVMLRQAADLLTRLERHLQEPAPSEEGAA